MTYEQSLEYIHSLNRFGINPGLERIEALCDDFCNDIQNTLKTQLKPRFSAGYGDLPLDTQKQIFSLLNLSKNIGLTLNDSLLMSPTKSVTAFIGMQEV